MYEIQCDGKMLNPCKGMGEQQARACFEMYSGPQASRGHSFTLLCNGKEIAHRDVPKGK